MVAGTAHQLQPAHRLARPGVIDPFQREAHMDEDPVAGGDVGILQHAQIDGPLRAEHIDQRQLTRVALQDPHDLPRNTQAHVRPPSVR